VADIWGLFMHVLSRLVVHSVILLSASAAFAQNQDWKVKPDPLAVRDAVRKQAEKRNTQWDAKDEEAAQKIAMELQRNDVDVNAVQLQIERVSSMSMGNSVPDTVLRSKGLTDRQIDRFYLIGFRPANSLSTIGFDQFALFAKATFTLDVSGSGPLLAFKTVTPAAWIAKNPNAATAP
jgi:hypothetical protein